MAYRNELAALRSRQDALRIEVQDLQAQLESIQGAIAATKDADWADRAAPAPPEMRWETSVAGFRIARYVAVAFGSCIALVLALNDVPWAEKAPPAVIFLLGGFGGYALMSRQLSHVSTVIANPGRLMVTSPKASWSGDWHQIEAVRVESVSVKQSQLYYLWLKRGGSWHEYELVAPPPEQVIRLKRWRDWYHETRRSL